jgi:putative FmdB family regulatory protein
VPIYEFYCPDCHTVFSFFAASSKSRKRPDCPGCGKPRLERRPSRFATISARSGEETEDDDPFAGLDESRLEGAMETLASEMERVGENENPKELGRVFRRFGELTGLELGPKMEEALRRMEGGEDLEAIEGEIDDDDDSLDDFLRVKKSLLRRARRPRVDDTLHFL